MGQNCSDGWSLYSRYVSFLFRNTYPPLPGGYFFVHSYLQWLRQHCIANKNERYYWPPEATKSKSNNESIFSKKIRYLSFDTKRSHWKFPDHLNDTQMKVIVEWQDIHGRWHRYQEMNHPPSAYKTAERRSATTGKRHRIVDERGNLHGLDWIGEVFSYQPLGVGELGFSKSDRSRKSGRFATEDTPPARRVELYLPEPFLDALEAFGKEHGLSRSKSILKLLEGRLEQPPAPAPLPPAQKDLVMLELVKRSNPLYKQFRSRHYIPDRGLVGQQLQYLVFYGSEVVGGIGGSSAVFTSQARDEYWASPMREKNGPDNSTASSTTTSFVWSTRHPTWRRWFLRCGEDASLRIGNTSMECRSLVLRHSWWRNDSGMERPGMVLATEQTTGKCLASPVVMEIRMFAVVSTRTNAWSRRSWSMPNGFQEGNSALTTPPPGMIRRRRRN